jgi:hypothetical protein
MIRSMREQLIKALIAHAHGDIQKHAANVEVYLNNPVGIGEHSNIIEAIEQEFDESKKPVIKEVGKFGDKDWSISIGDIDE